MLNEAGFVDVERVAETGFNSSSVTKGVLFRATKPVISDIGGLGGNRKRPEKTKAGKEKKPGRGSCKT